MDIFVCEVCSIYYVGPLCLRIIKICFFVLYGNFYLFIVLFMVIVKLFRSREFNSIDNHNTYDMQDPLCELCIL